MSNVEAIKKALEGVTSAFKRVLAEAPADADHYSIGFDCQGQAIRIDLADMRTITGLLTTLEALQRETEELKKKISGCDWYWPEEDTSSDACADGPWQIAETYDLKPADVMAYSRGGVVETRYFAFLPPADDSDSDDNFEIDEATEDAVVAKITAEIERRTALASAGEEHHAE